MSELVQAGAGVITVKGDGGAVREFHLMPLDLYGEEALWNHLEQLADERTKAARRAVLEDLGTSKAARWVVDGLLAAMAERIADPPTEPAVYAIRKSVVGVAVELWHRTKAQHDRLSLAEVKAVVTEANAAGIRRQIVELVAGAKRAESGAAKDDSKSLLAG